MKASFTIEAIRDGLSRLASMPGAHRSITGLSAVHLSADIEGVALTRTTGVAMLRVLVEAEIEEDGDAAVSLDRLAQQIQRVPTKTVELSADDKSLHVRGGKFTGRVTKIDFKELSPEVLGQNECLAAIDLAIEDFASLLSTASVACSSLEADGGLTGLSLKVHENELRVIGTDRKRFIMMPVPDVCANIDAIITRNAVESIAKAFGGQKGACEVAFYHNVITVKHESGIAVYNLMEANYPNCSPLLDLIAKSQTLASFKVNRDGLFDAIRAASPFADKDDTISIEISKDAIAVIGDNRSDAMARQEVDATCAAHREPLQVNAKYLYDMVGAMRQPASEVSLLLFNPANNARVLAFREPDRTGFVVLINKQ